MSTAKPYCFEPPNVISPTMYWGVIIDVNQIEGEHYKVSINVSNKGFKLHFDVFDKNSAELWRYMIMRLVQFRLNVEGSRNGSVDTSIPYAYAISDISVYR